MILACFNFTESKHSVVVVVIEPDNLGRMQKADPISLESLKRGGMLKPVEFPLDMSLLIAYEDDQEQLYKLAQGNPAYFVKYLERGRRWIEGVDGKEHTIPIGGKAAEPQA